MKIGVVYPQTEFGDDPIAIRDYAQTVEGLGFSHILAYSHVLGANPERAGGWQGPYTYQTTFQEPLVLFGFLAGVTDKLEFTTGIIILPQRQTALFAKQAATLDILSGGRLRLGIGIGWRLRSSRRAGPKSSDGEVVPTSPAIGTEPQASPDGDVLSTLRCRTEDPPSVV